MLQATILRAFYLGIVFLANLVLANTLLPLHFGNISLMIVNATFVSILSGYGSDNIILHYLSNKKWDNSFAFSFSWVMVFLQVIFYAFVQLVFYFLWGKTLLAQNDIAYWLLDFLYFFALIITEKYIILFYSCYLASLVNKLLFIGASIYFLVLIIVTNSTAFGYLDAMGLLISFSLFQAIFLASIFHFRTKLFSFEKIGTAIFFKTLQLSGVIMVTNVIQTLAYRIDFLLIKFYQTDYEVGIYSQANKFANLLWILPNIISMLLIPKFSSIENDHIPIIFRGAFYLNLLTCFLTIAISNILYFHFLMPEYTIGLEAFYLMLPGYVCWACLLYFSAFISWKGFFYYNLFASSFCLVLILFFDLLLIPKYSINGAALANTIAYSLTFVLYILLFKKLNPCTTYSLFILKKEDFKILKNTFR